MRAAALPRPDHRRPVQVAVDARRSVTPVPGVRAHRTAGLGERSDWMKAPPRIRIEHAAIDVAADAADLASASSTFAAAVHTRETTAEKIAAVLRTRRGVRRRADLLALLDDLADGACSVLEREWLHVARAHGLPDGDDAGRQAPDRVRGGRIYRDVDHRRWRLVLELDGRAHHESAAARDRDAVRDLESAVDDDLLTTRLSWTMAVREGCRTAALVATLLTRRGWEGTPRRCPRCPPA